MNITEPIWRNCHAWPARTAVVFGGRPMRYQALRLAAERALARLAAAGLVRGGVAALAVNNPLAYLILVLAAVRLGATITPFKVHWPAATQRELLARHGVRWLIVDQDAMPAEAANAGVTRLDARELLSMGVGGDGQTPAHAPAGEGEAIWHLALSSGTTGVFKSIPQSHARSLLAWTLVSDASSDPDERVLVMADLASAMGLGAAMRPLVAGTSVQLLPGFSASAFFEAVRRDQPTRVVTSTSNIGDVVAFARQKLPDSLSACASLRSVSVTGAMVPPTLREAVIAQICPQLEIPYGATETGRLATATPETLRARPDSAGRVHPWVQVQAVDDQHRPLVEGQHGMLRFRTPIMAGDYLGDQRATARSFRDGWCYTGDTGSVDGAGFLTLGGRTDHVLNLGGVKLDPAPIEQLMNGMPGVRESVALAIPIGSGVPALVAVLVADGPVDAEAIKQACRFRLGAAAVPAVVVAVPALPRNPAGKLLRAELAARVAAGLGHGPLARLAADASQAGAHGSD